MFGGELAKFLLKVSGKVEDAAHVLVSQYFLLATGRQTRPKNFCLDRMGRGYMNKFFNSELRFGIFEKFVCFPGKEKEDNHLCFHLVFDSIS